MTDFLFDRIDRFPEGTEVTARPVTSWPNGIPDTSTAPIGSATDTQTMGATGLTFEGLDEGVDYIAHAEVSDQDRYVRFKIVDPATMTGSTDAERIAAIAAHEAKTTAVHGIADTEAIGTDNTDADLAARGTILASTTLTANSNSVTTQDTPTDVTDLVITVPATTRPYVVRFVGNVFCGTADRQFTATICASDNTVLATGLGANPASRSVAIVAEYRSVATASETVYKVRLTNIAGTSTSTLIAAGTTIPACLYAVAV